MYGKTFQVTEFNDRDVMWIKEVIETIYQAGDIDQLKRLNVLNKYKGTSKWGDCRNVLDSAFIRLNTVLSDSEMGFKNTLMHELIHSFSSVPHGHGKPWKTFAKKYSELLGTEIKRVSDSSEKGVKLERKDRKPVRTIKCPICGHVHNFYRRTDRTYICNRCKVQMEDI